MSSPEAELLGRFVAAFKRGIEGEVAAMHGASDAFELPLSRVEDLGLGRYRFELADAGDRLTAGTACALRTPRGDQRVIIERCDDARVTLAADLAIDLTALPLALIVAP